MNEKTKEILEQGGWSIECESLFEIRHGDGSFATGKAAYLVVDALKEEFNPKKNLLFEYKNWKGEIGIRKVAPDSIWFGSTDYHKDEQWLLNGLDIDKQEYRDFAI